MDKGRRDNSWMKRIIVVFVCRDVMEGSWNRIGWNWQEIESEVKEEDG